MIKIISVLAFLLFCNSCESKEECPTKSDMEKHYPKTEKGIICKKYQEPMKHYQRYIDILCEDSTFSIHVDYLLETKYLYGRDFWDYVKVGDSIIKHKNSLEAKIIRKGIIKTFTVNCDNSK